MIYLLFSILCSVAIFIIFKYFEVFKVNNLHAIVVNYFVAFTTGWLLSGFPITLAEVPSQPWFNSSFLLGILFISLFQLMAYVSQKYGVAIVSVAVKMSLVIPVLFAVLYFREQLSIVQFTGILTALVAVYLSTKKSRNQNVAGISWLPLILFLGSGFLDTYIKYTQDAFVPEKQFSIFTSFSFALAGIIGILWILFKEKFKPNLSWRSIFGGIVLGVPNYGSIYFLLKSLSQEGAASSVIFPINNVGIVAISALVGFFFFKENLSRLNQVGIALAIISIVFISL